MRRRLLLVILMVGILSVMQLQVSSFVSGTTASRLTEPFNMTVEWTSVDPMWGREDDVAHYITTKTEPVIAVRALRDVFSLEFSDTPDLLHRLRAVADLSANAAGAHSIAASTPVFLVVENNYEGAFVHWVTESAVFLHYWAELLLRYPNLNLWVRNNKDYKKLIAALYGIGPERITGNSLLFFKTQ